MIPNERQLSTVSISKAVFPLSASSGPAARLAEKGHNQTTLRVLGLGAVRLPIATANFALETRQLSG
jgi:hypothetical protein